MVYGIIDGFLTEICRDQKPDGLRGLCTSVYMLSWTSPGGQHGRLNLETFPWGIHESKLEIGIRIPIYICSETGDEENKIQLRLALNVRLCVFCEDKKERTPEP